MRDRLIEVAHNYRLTPVKEELREDKGDDLTWLTDLLHRRGASEHAAIPQVIRKAYYR